MVKNLLKGVAVVLLVPAGLWWLFGPDAGCNARQLGCGIISLGPSGALSTILDYAVTVALAVPGIGLWHFASKYLFDAHNLSNFWCVLG